jgi:hypothetical protein
MVSCLKNLICFTVVRLLVLLALDSLLLFLAGVIIKALVHGLVNTTIFWMISGRCLVRRFLIYLWLGWQRFRWRNDLCLGLVGRMNEVKFRRGNVYWEWISKMQVKGSSNQYNLQQSNEDTDMAFLSWQQVRKASLRFWSLAAVTITKNRWADHLFFTHRLTTSRPVRSQNLYHLESQTFFTGTSPMGTTK